MTYIKAEIYRVFHTKSYLKLLGTITLLLLGSMIYSSLDSSSAEYFASMEVFLKVICLIVSIFFSVTIFKKKDIKVELLSMGLSRRHLFIYDLISLQTLTLLSLIAMGLLILSFSFIKALLVTNYAEGSSEFISFVMRLIILMVNVNNGVMGLTFALNNVALGVVTSFVIIPSVFQIGMYMTEGKIYEIFNKILLIQPFKLLDFGLAVGRIESGFIALTSLSFIFVFIFYLMGGYISFNQREIK